MGATVTSGPISLRTAHWHLGRRFMQTIGVLWYELESAKRQLKETLSECGECGELNLLAKAETLRRRIGRTAESQADFAVQLAAQAKLSETQT
jgi:ribosomal protein S27AE